MVKAMQAPKVEWLSYPSFSVDGWREVKLAIDGQVASFAVREEDWHLHPTEDARNAMLVRQATSYLAEFGDFRYQHQLTDERAQELYGSCACASVPPSWR